MPINSGGIPLSIGHFVQSSDLIIENRDSGMGACASEGLRLRMSNAYTTPLSLSLRSKS